MPLSVPNGSHVFVDATVFHYALIPTFDTSPDCLDFLDRAIAAEVSLSTNIQVLADVLHKAMTSEAAQIAGRDRSGIVGYLKRHPEIIRRCVEWPSAVARLNTIPLRILDIDIPLLEEAASLAHAYGLLTNDAVIVAMMRRHSIIHLATNDDDFDRVPGITVWKPRS